MNSSPFQFAVLRYYHDPVTQEFLNIGLVVYSKEARYLQSIINKRYGRVSKAFNGIDRNNYARMVNTMEYGIERLSHELETRTLFDNYPDSIEELLNRVLSPDDSSLRFGGFGGGVVIDLEAELSRLFARLVEKYEGREKSESRRDEEIWHSYSKLFADLNISQHLQPATIATESYEYIFSHAFKNDRWHPVEAVSFDLVDASYIIEKANKWIGRGILLGENPELGTLHFLLGQPKSPELMDAYYLAASNLETKIKGIDVKVVHEDDSLKFASEFAKFIDSHVQQKSGEMDM